jgi:hypothetical protein
VDTRSLDQVANDLPAVHMLDHDAQDPRGIHPIIQSGQAARARQRGKPATDERAGLCGDDLAHEYVRPLRTATEAALPHELGVFTSTVRFERGPEHLVKRRGTPAITALRSSADHDPEPAIRHVSGA